MNRIKSKKINRTVKLYTLATNNPIRKNMHAIWKHIIYMVYSQMHGIGQFVTDIQLYLHQDVVLYLQLT